MKNGNYFENCIEDKVIILILARFLNSPMKFKRYSSKRGNQSNLSQLKTYLLISIAQSIVFSVNNTKLFFHLVKKPNNFTVNNLKNINLIRIHIFFFILS